MKITADTNVLVRTVVQDEKRQTQVAQALLREADLIAVTVPCLCELVWVLRKLYALGHQDISAALTALINASNVVVNRPAVEAGLATLNAGGDFADGTIAYEGKWLGSDLFVSFDKKAVALISQQAEQARLLK